jgi:CubicO group peptidase (beta-lactamase class C family)
VAEAFQSGRTNDGRPTGYGFAWHLKDLDGVPVAQHEGCWAGYRNAIVRVPGKKLTVIVLTNAADGAEFWNCDDSVKLARELARR